MSTQQIIDGWEHGHEPYSETPIATDQTKQNGQAPPAGCHYDNPKAIKIIECGCCSQYHRLNYFGDCRNDDERFADPEDFEARWYGGGYPSIEVSA